VNVLALNAGSGSLRYKLVAGGNAKEQVLLEGAADRVQGRATVDAAERAVTECLPRRVDAIGCRVVHGGNQFTAPTRITPAALDAIRALNDLAPLHNPTDVAIIEAATRRAPGVPAFAVFDTVFHRTLP
jgi:acetate kinase